MGIISWIILGLIAGALAKLILPGKQGGGIIVTIILGIVGAFLGGWLGSFIPGLSDGINSFSIGTIITSVIGAIIVLLIYGAVAESSAGPERAIRTRASPPGGALVVSPVSCVRSRVLGVVRAGSGAHAILGS